MACIKSTHIHRTNTISNLHCFQLSGHDRFLQTFSSHLLCMYHEIDTIGCCCSCLSFCFYWRSHFFSFLAFRFIPTGCHHKLKISLLTHSFNRPTRNVVTFSNAQQMPLCIVICGGSVVAILCSYILDLVFSTHQIVVAAAFFHRIGVANLFQPRCISSVAFFIKFHPQPLSIFSFILFYIFSWNSQFQYFIDGVITHPYILSSTSTIHCILPAVNLKIFYSARSLISNNMKCSRCHFFPTAAHPSHQFRTLSILPN